MRASERDHYHMKWEDNSPESKKSGPDFTYDHNYDVNKAQVKLDQLMKKVGSRDTKREKWDKLVEALIQRELDRPTHRRH